LQQKSYTRRVLRHGKRQRSGPYELLGLKLPPHAWWTVLHNELKNKPREFLAATGLKLDEFEKLLPAFQAAYEQKYPPNLTQEGKTRQRQLGGGATGALPKSADKLFFILVYQKTNPLQTMHGLQLGLSQPQANDWIHRLLPVLQQALRDLGEAPERDARHVATSELARAGGSDP